MERLVAGEKPLAEEQPSDDKAARFPVVLLAVDKNVTDIGRVEDLIDLRPREGNLDNVAVAVTPGNKRRKRIPQSAG